MTKKLPNFEMLAEIEIDSSTTLDDRLEETFQVEFLHDSGRLFPACRNPMPNKFLICLTLPPLRTETKLIGHLRLRVNIDMRSNVDAISQQIVDL